MTMPELPIDGGCRCGKVRFRISVTPVMTSVCHCSGCQRMTASAFSTTIMVPSEGFAVIAGDPVIGGLHGDQSRHHHCDWCKSWLFTRIPPEYGPFVNVRATMLDDATWFAPYMETFTDEKLPWAQTGATRSYPTFPNMADYAALLEAYREQA